MDEELSPAVLAARDQLQNPRLLSDRIAMGRALWRDLVVGFSSQLGRLGLGFSQLAALYVLADGRTTTVTDLAEALQASRGAISGTARMLATAGMIRRTKRGGDRREFFSAPPEAFDQFLRGADRAGAVIAVGDFESRILTMREARDIVYGVVNCSKPIVSAMTGPAGGAQQPNSRSGAKTQPK